MNFLPSMYLEKLAYKQFMKRITVTSVILFLFLILFVAYFIITNRHLEEQVIYLHALTQDSKYTQTDLSAKESDSTYLEDKSNQQLLRNLQNILLSTHSYASAYQIHCDAKGNYIFQGIAQTGDEILGFEQELLQKWEFHSVLLTQISKTDSSRLSFTIEIQP